MGRPGEKKVATWKYESRAGTLDVPVYMIDYSQKGRYEQQQAGKVAVFRVKLDDPEIRLENTDINALKTEVWAAIKDKLSIVWRDMLYVQTEGNAHGIDAKDPEGYRRKGERGAGKVEFDYKPVQITEFNGKKMSRHLESVYNGNSTWSTASEGWPEVGHPSRYHYGKDKVDRSEVRALIPDTPENRAALDQIADGFKALHKRLLGLLSPKSIERTLANVGTAGLLLPAPEAVPEVFDAPEADDEQDDDDS
jgi:hypothetical protein